MVIVALNFRFSTLLTLKKHEQKKSKITLACRRLQSEVANRAGCTGGGNVRSSLGKALLNGQPKVFTSLIGPAFTMRTKEQKGGLTNKQLERFHTNGCGLYLNVGRRERLTMNRNI